MKLLDMLKTGSSVMVVYNELVNYFKDQYQEFATVPIPLAGLLDKEYDEDKYLALAEELSKRYYINFSYSFEEFLEAVDYFNEEVSE